MSADNTQKSTSHSSDGEVQSLVVTLPVAVGEPVSPAVIVFNSSIDFAVTANGTTGSDVFSMGDACRNDAAWSAKGVLTQAIIVHGQARRAPRSGGCRQQCS